MARKKSSVMAERVLTFAMSPTQNGNTTTSYVDLAQVLSAVNRRFYRQGRDYHISGIEFQASGIHPNSSISVSAVMPTWVPCTAWKKAMAVWDKIQKRALNDASSSVRAKYRDFKVHLDQGHVDAGRAANLIPIDLAGNPVATGEWDMSTIDITTASSGINTEYFLKFLGADASNAKGLITGYRDSRAYPALSEPLDSEPEDGWYSLAADYNDANEHVIDAATDENDSPPYAVTLYNGDGLGSFDAPRIVGSRSLGSPMGGVYGRLGSFVACAGLLRLDHFVGGSDSTHNVLVKITLKEGSYKGVAAPAIGGPM